VLFLGGMLLFGNHYKLGNVYPIMNKRGIWAVVAAVLLILITIVALMIIWMAILPLIRQDFGSDIFDMQLQILTSEGYTVYDEVKHFAFVHVKRGPDNITIDGLQIIFNFNGDSIRYQTKSVPGSNGNMVYSFNFTRDGVGGIPGKVAVAPIIIKNNKRRVGDILDEVNIPIKRATVTPENNDDSMDNIFIPVDEGEPCFDFDGDGYGNPGASTCSGGPALDCDDDEFWINPGIPERCWNGIDDNCNSLIDAADPGCNVAFMSDVVSYWDFNDNGDDSFGLNNMNIYGGSNVSYVAGITANNKAINLGTYSHMLSRASEDTMDYDINNGSFPGLEVPCGDNGISDGEGTISIWFKKLEDNTVPTAAHEYVFSMFNWSGGVANRMYINYIQGTDFLEIARSTSPPKPADPIIAGIPVTTRENSGGIIIEGKDPSWYPIGIVDRNKWHFAIFTWEDLPGFPGFGESNFYLDGKHEATLSYGDMQNTNQIHFGSWADYPGCDSSSSSFRQVPPSNTYHEYFHGQLDEARAFDVALTAGEAKQYYDMFDPVEVLNA